MTLAPSGARGKYLALWIVSRNLGQLVGGAIKSVFLGVSAQKRFADDFDFLQLILPS